MHIPANMLVFITTMAIGYQSIHLIYRKNKAQTLLHSVEIPLSLRYCVVWIVFIGICAFLMSVSIRHFIAETYCNTVHNSTLNRNQHPELNAIQNAIFWDSSNPKYWYKLAWKYIEFRNQLSEQKNEKKWIDWQKKIIHALEQAIKTNPCEAEYHIRLAWEYHRMRRHDPFPEKRASAADLTMNHAEYVVRNNYYYQNLELAHYWNMRSSQYTDKHLKEKAWQKSVMYYQKVVKLDRNKSRRKQIIQQLKMYSRDEKAFKTIFGS
jgi:hypothetical protein